MILSSLMFLSPFASPFFSDINKNIFLKEYNSGGSHFKDTEQEMAKMITARMCPLCTEDIPLAYLGFMLQCVFMYCG